MDTKNFDVVCDGSNNTPEDAADGRVNIRVVMPPYPRVYHKHRASSTTAYQNCGVCEKPFDGTKDAVAYFVSGPTSHDPRVPSGGQIMNMAHVLCVPTLDLSKATTFVP